MLKMECLPSNLAMSLRGYRPKRDPFQKDLNESFGIDGKCIIILFLTVVVNKEFFKIFFFFLSGRNWGCLDKNITKNLICPLFFT